jgi:hypothetical protein
VGFESGCDFSGSFPGAAYVEDDDVSLHRSQVDLDTRDAGHSFGEEARGGVVFVQTSGALLKRDKTGGCEDSRLTHTASERLAYRARALNEVLAADEK